MADLPASVGWMTVDASVILGLADTSDAGEEPDAVAAIGSVLFTPPPEAAQLWVYDPGQILLLQQVAGVLTADGIVTSDGVPIQLVAPVQDAISVQWWKWSAKFTPDASQSWQSFTTTFLGSPGDTVKIGNPIFDPPVAPVSVRPVIIVPTVPTMRPAGAIVGDLVYAEDTATPYRITGV